VIESNGFLTNWAIAEKIRRRESERERKKEQAKPSA